MTTRLLAAALLAATACAPLGARTGAYPASLRAALRHDIDSMVLAPEFRNAHWGVLIVDPRTGDTLYSRNAGKLFMPASNMKIITGATALATLGADYRFRTTYAAGGPVRDSVLEGDLIVIGRGDPTLSDKMRTDAMAPLREVADSLLARGIRRIGGAIVPGGDAFPDAIYGNGWSWDDFDYAYSAGVDELFFNEGFTRVVLHAGPRAGDSATFRVSPVAFPPIRAAVTTVAATDSAVAGGGVTDSLPRAVTRVRWHYDSTSRGYLLTGTILLGDSATVNVAHRDPLGAFVAALRAALAERGISVADTTPTAAHSDSAPAADSGRVVDTLFATLSPPLREVLPVLEKPSQNQIAEILLKTMGLEKTGVGTADSGRAVVRRQLEAWGVAPDGFAMADGSGLSRLNYLTPETVVRVLDAIRRDTAFAAFYDALPVAGVDGTISNRMRGTPAQGNVRAKTGFVGFARSLSGYVTTADGELLIFSMLCNNYTVPTATVNRVQDQVAARLASLRASEGDAIGR